MTLMNFACCCVLLWCAWRFALKGDWLWLTWCSYWIGYHVSRGFFHPQYPWATLSL